MPPSTSYPPAKPPDSPVDDSDSDLEIDLEELDPQADASGPDQLKRRGVLGQTHDPAEQRAPRIALRTLRMNNLRRSAKRNGYGELGRSRDGGGSRMPRRCWEMGMPATRGTRMPAPPAGTMRHCSVDTAGVWGSDGDRSPATASAGSA